MSESPSTGPRTEGPGAATPGTTPDAGTDTRELLIEEISIDGMCGVY